MKTLEFKKASGRIQRARSITMEELEANLKRIARHHFAGELTQSFDDQPEEEYYIASDRIIVEIELARTINVSVYFTNDFDYSDIKNLEDIAYVPGSTWTVNIGWSSTGRSLASAIAAVRLYQRAIDFASEFMAWAEGEIQYIEIS